MPHAASLSGVTIRSTGITVTVHFLALTGRASTGSGILINAINQSILVDIFPILKDNLGVDSASASKSNRLLREGSFFMSFVRVPTCSLALPLFFGVFVSLGSQPTIAGGAEQAPQTAIECSIYGEWGSISRANYDAAVTVTPEVLIENGGSVDTLVPMPGLHHPKYAALPSDQVAYYSFPEGQAPYPFFAVIIVEKHRHWGCVLTYEAYRNVIDGQIDTSSFSSSMSYKRN
ncbi:MAG: hypothetical protein ACPGOV_03365 [Magnetovibrionaceae bacterium]